MVYNGLVISNQALIKESGIDAFIKQQSTRMSILQTMLEHYNDGKSKSFYCLSAALLSIKSLKESLLMADKKIKEESAGEKDTKTKAKILKDFLNRFAADEDEELRLRK